MEEISISHTRWSRYLQVRYYTLIWENCTQTKVSIRSPCNKETSQSCLHVL